MEVVVVSVREPGAVMRRIVRGLDMTAVLLDMSESVQSPTWD